MYKKPAVLQKYIRICKEVFSLCKNLLFYSKKAAQ